VAVGGGHGPVGELARAVEVAEVRRGVRAPAQQAGVVEVALSGQRILIVDLDPQGNATSGLGIAKDALERSAYDALVDSAPLRDVVVPTAIDRLTLVPSSTALSGAEVELVAVDRRERRLARALAGVGAEYDWIFLDGPPSLGLLTVNALTAADAVLIPIQCEYYALEGLAQLTATVNLVRDHLNPELALNGVILTMYDARTNLSAEVAAEVRRHVGSAVYQTVIPRSVSLAEAPSFGKPIAHYRPESRGAAAYAALAEEFTARAASAARATAPTDHRPTIQAGAA
jgi:chromosome partitioning protein